MREADGVIGIAVSDMHLCPTAPPAWSGEPDWYLAMQRYAEQLNTLSGKYRVPIVFAGDLFDHWKVPPETINFALHHLPPMIGVPGQHDLPYHDYNQIKKSAFWTVVSSGRIILLEPGQPYAVGNMILHGFPWGAPITPCPQPNNDFGINIAVVHSYIWRKGKCFPGAPEAKRVGSYAAKLKGYETAIFGDNHKGFSCRLGRSYVFNCGGFMRRKSDEIAYEPQVGLIMSNGEVVPHYLDTSLDKFEAVGQEVETQEWDPNAFIQELGGLEQVGLDFRDLTHRYLDFHDISSGVRKIILRSMENKHGS